MTGSFWWRMAASANRNKNQSQFKVISEFVLIILFFLTIAIKFLDQFFKICLWLWLLLWFWLWFLCRIFDTFLSFIRLFFQDWCPNINCCPNTSGTCKEYLANWQTSSNRNIHYTLYEHSQIVCRRTFLWLSKTLEQYFLGAFLT